MAAKHQAKRSASAPSRPTRSSNPMLQERASKGTANARLKEQLAIPTRPVKKRVSVTKPHPSNSSTAATDGDNNAELEVEYIAAKGLAADGSVLYQVRWRGYGEADDTWEPVENLTGAKKAIQLFESEIQLDSDSAGDEKGSGSATTASKKPVTQRTRKKQSSTSSQVRSHLFVDSFFSEHQHVQCCGCRPRQRMRRRLVPFQVSPKLNAGT